MSSYSARFAPTSTPRVGSFAMRTRGRRKSHFAKSTFCWFPPESVASRVEEGVVRDVNAIDQLSRLLGLLPTPQDTASAHRRQMRERDVLTMSGASSAPRPGATPAAARFRVGSRPVETEGRAGARRAAPPRHPCGRRRRAASRSRFVRCRRDPSGRRSRPPGCRSDTSLHDAGAPERPRADSTTGASGRGVYLLGEGPLERAPEHRCRERSDALAGDRASADELAVPQDAHGVGHRDDVFERMRDVHDRRAVGLQARTMSSISSPRPVSARR